MKITRTGEVPRTSGYMLGLLGDDEEDIFVLTDRPSGMCDISQSLRWQLLLGTPRQRYAIVSPTTDPGQVRVVDPASHRNGATFSLRQGARTREAFTLHLDRIWPQSRRSAPELASV